MAATVTIDLNGDNMRQTILASFTATTLLANAAYAADMAVKAPAPPPPPPVYAWTGCYIGGNIGWAQAETRLLFDGFDDFGRSKDGFAGGGQIGCDYQFASNWVVGVQGLFDGTSISTSHVSTLFDDTTFHAKVPWFGTITALLGYAITPAFLLYGKVGWGFYESRLTANDTVTGVQFGSISKTQSGLDAGVGGEWMFAPNWSLWVEWDHIFAQDKTIFFPNLDGGTSATVRRDFDKVLVGFNWRFGGGYPVRAAY